MTSLSVTFTVIRKVSSFVGMPSRTVRAVGCTAHTTHIAENIAENITKVHTGEVKSSSAAPAAFRRGQPAGLSFRHPEQAEAGEHDTGDLLLLLIIFLLFKDGEDEELLIALGLLLIL